MEATIIKIVLAVIFGLSVVGKLTGKTKSTFENAGYGSGMMYAIAIAEMDMGSKEAINCCRFMR
jgi:hypothetical protein